ncbi:isocitrate/isopropylmalate family dehydrogenase [Streptomyces rapamycinicus]|uniref:3-isopropylmalate dehydrogenase n=2 Tax=Streptomyces rapamycinicus TaxID=1226757 RepID=A0A3L8QYB6_STRRN|nr:isocitrate/isopropylmalate family dehydrogenase [Streptomyces rapamycinicus]MBB4787980.1 hypothetical protein [Streptomyces rapamycinicus]RLV72318.1 3-isopropylmalate dehydrogenase [Streptomyces rapamycinicus NRRL 5491]UTP36387.1 hypothetical protein LIV37_48170 [Streptomyces rapamycinicus NRRL 5491]
MMGTVTRAATERVARVAFEPARSRRKKLTVVHKANVLKLTTGLFRTVCQEVAQASHGSAPDIAGRRRLHHRVHHRRQQGRARRRGPGLTPGSAERGAVPAGCGRDGAERHWRGGPQP